MLSPEELLRANHIVLASYGSGRHYATCPVCSKDRKTRHQKLKCLGVTIDGDRVRWGCNHCEWTGPERGAAGGNGADRVWPNTRTITYDYGDDLRKVRNPDGEQPRYFWQHRVNGEWQSGTGGIPTNKLLYRIDEFLAATADGSIGVIVEGEKDVETVWALGLPATCNAHGASEKDKKPKWTEAHSRQLAGRNLVVLSDYDDAGEAHAATVMELTKPYAASIRYIDLIGEYWPSDDEDKPAGGDISDVRLAKVLSDQDLVEILDVPPPPPKREVPLLRWNDAKAPRSMGTLVQGVCHAASMTLIYGPPKSGKSFLATDLLLSISGGDREWMGHKIVRPGPVLYIACEGHAGFWKRLQAAEKRRGALFAPQFVLGCGRPHLIRFDEHGYHAFPRPEAVLEAVADMAAQEGQPVAVVIDTMFRAIGGGNVNNSEHVNAFMAACAAIMDLGIAVIVIHHETKAGNTPAGSVALLGAADTIIRTSNLDDKTHAWEIEAAKDEAVADAQRFRLEIEDVGTDPDGQPAKSCVVIPIAGKPAKTKAKLTDKQTALYRVITDVIASGGTEMRPKPDMASVRGTSRKAVRIELVKAGWFHEPHLDLDNVLRPGFTAENNALTALANRGLIAFDRWDVWLTS